MTATHHAAAPPALGWIVVELPPVMRIMAPWRVRVGAVSGPPGCSLAAPPGECLVVIEAGARSPGSGVAARLRVHLPVMAGRVTCLRLPCAGIAPIPGTAKTPGLVPVEPMDDRSV
jgi:hypothetical protein